MITTKGFPDGFESAGFPRGYGWVILRALILL
jgi:hypothetical protein